MAARPQHFKTKAFNVIRQAFTNEMVESLLLKVTSGKKPDSFFAKFIPMPHLYRSPAIRKVSRRGINYELDIADLVDWHIYFALADDGLDALFSLVGEHDTVLDVGANIGHTLLRIAQLARLGRVIGFEPNSDSLKKCLKNVSLNTFSNIKIENVALGENQFQSSVTVRDEHNRGMNRLEIDSAGQIMGTSLDAWLAHHTQPKIDLIKIDVEGYELKVLKGAAATLTNNRPQLFIELDDNNLKHYGDSAAALLQFLWSFEYQVTDFEGKAIYRELDVTACHTDIIATPI